MCGRVGDGGRRGTCFSLENISGYWSCVVIGLIRRLMVLC